MYMSTLLVITLIAAFIVWTILVYIFGRRRPYISIINKGLAAGTLVVDDTKKVISAIKKVV